MFRYSFRRNTLENLPLICARRSRMRTIFFYRPSVEINFHRSDLRMRTMNISTHPYAQCIRCTMCYALLNRLNAFSSTGKLVLSPCEFTFYYYTVLCCFKQQIKSFPRVIHYLSSCNRTTYGFTRTYRVI